MHARKNGICSSVFVSTGDRGSGIIRLSSLYSISCLSGFWLSWYMVEVAATDVCNGYGEKKTISKFDIDALHWQRCDECNHNRYHQLIEPNEYTASTRTEFTRIVTIWRVCLPYLRQLKINLMLKQRLSLDFRSSVRCVQLSIGFPRPWRLWRCPFFPSLYLYVSYTVCAPKKW